MSLRRILTLTLDSWWRFLADDGWAFASYVAMSALISLFPFLIFITALAGFFGSKELADEVATLLLQAWPKQAAAPIASEIHSVLTGNRRDLLTFGVVLSIWFSSNGIEAMRVAMNRAYDVKEMRPWWLLRLESIAFVLIGAMALLALAFLVVLGPLIWRVLLHFFPTLSIYWHLFTLLRFAVTGVVTVVALAVSHMWLPAGRRTFAQIWPGITVTLTGMLICAVGFGNYLARFSRNYVTTYAGLASVMIAIGFLYLIAAIFIYGGELNAVIMRASDDRRQGSAHKKIGA